MKKLKLWYNVVIFLMVILVGGIFMNDVVGIVNKVPIWYYDIVIGVGVIFIVMIFMIRSRK